MTIKFNYEQTVAQARLLDELANDIQNQSVKKLAEVGGNIEAAWSGEAAKTYIRYIRGVQDDIGKKAKYLRDTAEYLRAAAKKMQEADASARQSAQRI
ncbi:MAG TPA: WXG100 family type VII secretion target [Negativicutes bacterium]|jgi:Proteins of 100 residues with WXG.|nr:WXG100 family type VII secretion target [Negativicutes bacterium]